METVTGLAIIAFASKIVDLVKYIFNIRSDDPVIRAGSINGIVTLLTAFVAGVLATLLVGVTAFAKQDIFGFTLSDQGFWGQIVIGLLIASAGAFAKDSIKAVNPHDKSTGAPALLSGLIRKAAPNDPETVPITDLQVTTDSGDKNNA